MGEYVMKRQDKAAQYIVTRMIIELCKETVRIPREFIYKRCREQEGLDLAGARKVAVEVEV